MTPFLRGLARAAAEAFELPDPILEIGSRRVPGQEGLADLRSLFTGREFCGLDLQPGPGVDLVADVEELPLPDASVGTVVALSTFEHVPRFWRAFEEIRRVLRPDGMLLVSCPFYFHIHEYPSDYWRFTPQALELLLEDYPSKVIGWHGPRTRPANVWAAACRAERPAISAAEYERYRLLMGRYARQPLPWPRRLRYLLGRLVSGSRPFAPYLDRERWETRLLNRECHDKTDPPEAGPLHAASAGRVGVHR
jgi:SAM-dependent methyltransferase